VSGQHPGDNYGTCSYTTPTRALALGNCTDGGGAVRAGRVWYGHSAGWVSWGESQWSGSWAGASTNGGTNLIVNHASCAERAQRGQEIWGAFAGLHLLANTLVHTGDTDLVADRGSSFAIEYIIAPNYSVSDAWVYGMNNISERNEFCQARPPAWTVYGGGFGASGCAGHVITSMGATQAEANTLLNETWWDLLNDSIDAKGRSFWSSKFICNYDCSTWTFSL
jgi:hypothetical protein